MGALDRAEQDERQGDLGSARVRLISLATTSPYSPELYERIARLCCRMGDRTEAGRWYLLCDSADTEAAACIERLVTRHRGEMAAVLSALPTSMIAKLGSGPLPAGVSRRLSEYGLRDQSAAALARQRERRAARGTGRFLWVPLVLTALVILLAAWGMTNLVMLLFG